MAVRIFGRVSCPLTQCLKYSVSNNSVAGQRAFLNSVRRCQTQNDKSAAASQCAGNNSQAVITLVFPDGERALFTLERAQRLAQKRNCELINCYDEQDARIVYRLIPLAGSNKDEAKNSKKPVVEQKPKEIEITTTTTERDLMVKCKKIVKLVQNNHRVRVFLNSAEKSQKKTNTPEQEITEIIRTAIKDFATMKEESRNNNRTILLLVPLKPEEVQANAEQAANAKPEKDPEKPDEAETKAA